MDEREKKGVRHRRPGPDGTRRRHLEKGAQRPGMAMAPQRPDHSLGEDQTGKKAEKEYNHTLDDHYFSCNGCNRRFVIWYRYGSSNERA